MIITRLDQLTQEITRFHEAKQQADSAQRFSTRAKQLYEPSIQLDSLATLMRAFQHRGIQISLDTSQVTAFAKQLRAVASAYYENPQNIVTSGEQRYTFWEALTTLPNVVSGALQQAWSKYVDSKLPFLPVELLQILARISVFQDHVGQIQLLYAEVQRLRARLPQSGDQIDRVDDIAAELRATLQTLPTEGMSVDVREFLAAAVVGDAQLAQLTSSVVEWLQSHNLAGSVRLSLKA